jgi:hypothetical protein
MARSILSALIVLLAASPARAQQVASSFDELRGLVGPGEIVHVTNANGTKARGRIVEVSGSSLDVILGSDDAVLRFSEHDVNNILAERHDSIWNGPLIGLAVGAGAGLIIELGAKTEYQSFNGGGAVGLGTLGFLIGLSIDALNREKVMVYVHPRDPRAASLRIAPILSKSSAGLQVAIGF